MTSLIRGRVVARIIETAEGWHVTAPGYVPQTYASLRDALQGIRNAGIPYTLILN